MTGNQIPHPAQACHRYKEDIQYYIAKIDAGETCGYIETDLIYPQDLIANAGDSVVTILDKIKNYIDDEEQIRIIEKAYNFAFSKHSF